MKISHIFVRYEGLMEVICETLFRAIYSDYEVFEEELQGGGKHSFEDCLTRFHQLNSFFEQVPLLRYHMQQIAEASAREQSEMRGQIQTKSASSAAISLWKRMAKATEATADGGADDDEEEEDYFGSVAGLLNQARSLSSDDKEAFLLQMLMTASGGTSTMLLRILPETCARLRHTPGDASLEVARTMCGCWLDPKGGANSVVRIVWCG
jgi:inorganic triphosphatase YgiF